MSVPQRLALWPLPGSATVMLGIIGAYAHALWPLPGSATVMLGIIGAYVHALALYTTNN